MCAFWPARVHDAVPALIVHADGDFNATSPLIEAMHAALTGSRMITLTHTRTHGVYLFRGSSCVDDAVNGNPASGRHLLPNPSGAVPAAAGTARLWDQIGCCGRGRVPDFGAIRWGFVCE